MHLSAHGWIWLGLAAIIALVWRDRIILAVLVLLMPAPWLKNGLLKSVAEMEAREKARKASGR